MRQLLGSSLAFTNLSCFLSENRVFLYSLLISIEESAFVSHQYSFRSPKSYAISVFGILKPKIFLTSDLKKREGVSTIFLGAQLVCLNI